VYTVTRNGVCAQSARDLSEEWKELAAFENETLQAGYMSVQLNLASKLDGGGDMEGGGGEEEAAVAAVAAAAAAPNKFKFKTWSGRQPNPVGSNYIRDVQVAFSEQHERYVKERVEKRREYVIRCGYYHNGLYTLSYDIGRPAVCVKYSCIYIPWVLS